MWKAILKKSLKISAGFIASIFVADWLGLKYFVTAGIVNILGLGKTQRETYKSASHRGLAFAGGVAIAYLCFELLGINLWGFSAYICLFVPFCLYFRWREAVVIDTVLISHFLSEGSMSLPVLWNEIQLFLVGTFFAILVNLSLHPNEKKFSKRADEVDEEIKKLMLVLSDRIRMQDKSKVDFEENIFADLDEKLYEARKCALTNYDNSIFRKDSKESEIEIDYIEMRQKQRMLLEEINYLIKTIHFTPAQANEVADFLCHVQEEHQRYNPVVTLLEEVDQLFENMKTEELPQTREEFEARAGLFYILKHIRYLLRLKRAFAEKYADHMDPVKAEAALDNH